MSTDPIEYIWPGILAAQAMHAAAELRIPDLLAAGPKTIAELASESGAHPAALERLLRALGTLDMFARESDGRFRNTTLSELLRTDHPQSQRNAALFLPAAFLWRPLGELSESVRTGEPAFERLFGQPFFDYLTAHPADAALFNAVMTEGTAWTVPALLAAYDFSRFKCVADIGGGQGALLRAILAAFPKLHGILFDVPPVVAGAPAILTGEIAARCEIMAGSFFDSVPEGADLYLMKGVIHDWPDADATKILSNARRAMRPDATLLLIEGIADSATRPAGLMELLMLVIGGRERTEADFRALLANAGLAVARIVPTEASALIECHPISPGS
ncbi:MAG: methyltransferase [Bryobacteraceae bacterium]